MNNKRKKIICHFFFHCFFFIFFNLCVVLQPASYGKKNGMWYASPGNQGWGNKSAARNSSVLDADITSTTPNVLKPSAGRVIRIVNNLDHNVQVNLNKYTKKNSN